VSDCDREASIRGDPGPIGGGCAMGIKKNWDKNVAYNDQVDLNKARGIWRR
jgi:hypothetical protein